MLLPCGSLPNLAAHALNSNPTSPFDLAAFLSLLYKNKTQTKDCRGNTGNEDLKVTHSVTSAGCRAAFPGG